MSEATLKVSEAFVDDVNNGIVRIDPTTLKELGIKAGDTLEIEGKKKTVATADIAYPGDRGNEIIRMDGQTRRNALSGIGEFVKIRKAQITPATKIVIKPFRTEVTISEEYTKHLKENLIGKTLMEGDSFYLCDNLSKRFSKSPLTALLQNPNFNFLIKFVAQETEPKNTAVSVTKQTEIKLTK